ncbi:MAG TPA: antibiotic biosynthesis monooxygenase [Chloroflexia bacterium]|nr:antibiotic biosynthesis monooxygenase [Chloroflexia bacterium]
MTYLLVRHNVEDYNKWRLAYDGHAGFRKESGSQGTRVLRDANDPSNVVVIVGWEDLGHAQQFAHSASLHEVMGQAGVVGRPDIYFLEEIDTQPA